MQLLAALGVFFLTLLIFLAGYVFGRNNGVRACQKIVNQLNRDLLSMEDIIKKKGG